MSSMPRAFDSDAQRMLGAAALIRAAYEGADLGPTLEGLKARIVADPRDSEALMDLSVLMLVGGHRELALELQRAALRVKRCFTQVHGAGNGLRLLAFKAPGDLMANTPVEFLLEGSDTILHSFYVDEATVDINALPEHDVAIVCCGESSANRMALENLSHLLADWPKPLLNGAPERIAALTRTGVAARLVNQSGVVVPPTEQVDRRSLQLLAQRAIGSLVLLPGRGFPALIRPVGSHAGKGLEKVDNEDALARYLGEHTDDLFYVTQFVDYSGRDGRFRKCRVAVIDGRPYASHLAISSHWMVHYLNADMETNASRRAEEQAWMQNFESDFAVRHKQAFETLARCLGLDYFAVDCAELPDGRLLLFEADVAMIVHALDPTSLFPYKKPAMRRLFGAYLEALTRRHQRAQSLDRATCAHSGRPTVYQRSRNDSLICGLAMLTGRTYEEVVAQASAIAPSFPPRGPMSHSILRNVAHHWGYALLSGIYMNWDRPAIIGVRSPTTPNADHAVFWDGEKVIDPGPSLVVDREYIDRNGIEFTQRASDLEAVIRFESSAQQATENVSIDDLT
jgi:hypothetical protein